MAEPLPPIVKTIDVPCDQARAFEIFVDGLPGWWPVEQRSMSLMWNGGRPAAALQVEARACAHPPAHENPPRPDWRITSAP